MMLTKLADALRREPLPQLAREAAWRSVRRTRQAAFRLTGGEATVHFRTISYYAPRGEDLTSEERDRVIDCADTVLAGSVPLPGYGCVPLGERPSWHLDWVSGKSWPLKPARHLRIVRHDGSDVKAPWELSRLQWGPVVARAWKLTGDERYRTRLKALLADWIHSNPLGQGVHWTVAMEAALRGISLCLTLEQLWPFAAEEEPWLKLLERCLWQHLRFIEVNNEFSWLLRSNHYLSNLVGMTTLSACLEGHGLARRRLRYRRAVQREVLLQTYADGGDREASTGYHLLVMQMAQHSLRVQQKMGIVVAPEFTARLARMLAWKQALADETGPLPCLGDCDSGYVEWDFAPQAQTPTADGLSILPDSGIAVIRASGATVIFSAMPNGLGGKGSHTHCDKLSFVLRLDGEEVFTDTGSRCYTRSAAWRNRDRSTAAHSTLRVDELEQNSFRREPQFLFQMGNEAKVLQIEQIALRAVRASHLGYSALGIEHRRSVELGEQSLSILDEVTGPGSHTLDLHFILGPGWTVYPDQRNGEQVTCRIAGERSLTLACAAQSTLELTVGAVEIAREYGASLPATAIRVRTVMDLPAALRTSIHWSDR